LIGILDQTIGIRMDKLSKIILCVAVFIIVILCVVFLIATNISVYDFISGFWVADSDFLKSSDLSSAYIMLEPKQSSKIEGFLSMTNKANASISNQKITLSKINSMTVGKNTYKMSNVNITYADTDILPKKLDIIIDMNSGLMTFSDKTKLYAVFIKDNETTNNI
jgi:hypothetical protein